MIILKNEAQIDGIRSSCHMLCELLDSIPGVLHDGLSTKDLDTYCHTWIVKRGARPACLHFEGFPAATCISVNEEVIHGIPKKNRIIREGDLVSVDLCINLNGFISDSARTYIVGKTTPERERLVRVTRECLYLGIEAAGKSGARVMDISRAIYDHANKNGFGVNRDYTGHGVGLNLHEDPEIPNYVSPRFSNPRLKPGMVIAIEPMIHQGTYKCDTLRDGWTVVTSDGKCAAHFEHTVAIMKDGVEILSQI